jgi:type IV secretion system protein VirD4
MGVRLALCSPLRGGRYLLQPSALSFLLLSLFVAGFAGGFARKNGFGSPERLPALIRHAAVLLILVFRFLTNPMIEHFGDMDGETHGSARFATNKEVAPSPAPIRPADRPRRQNRKSSLRYDGPAHLLTMAPTRTGKGVGTIIPNLLTADRSVICIDPKGENARIAGRARQKFGPVHVLDPFGVTGQSPRPPSIRSTSSTRPASMWPKMQAPWPTPSCSMNRAWPAKRIGTRKPRR